MRELSKVFKEPGQALALPEPIRGDRWLFASMMQKSVRRGDQDQAARAAYALWHEDRRKFWDRLLVIALEDIGMGSPDVLVQVLVGIASPKLRRGVGDIQMGLHLSRLLCGAVKSRLSDAVFIQAEKAAHYAELREQFAGASDRLLRRCVVDKQLPLIERALAVWYLAGTKKFPSDVLPPRQGDVAAAIAAIRASCGTGDLTEACVGVMSRMPWPLSLHLPLIHQEAQRHQTSILHHAIPASPDIEGMPVCSADIFTRVGKASFRELQRAVPALQPFTAQQLGLGIFYLDGGLVDKELTAPGLNVIQRAGEMADLESAGLSPSGYADLRHTLCDSMELLNDIRQTHLHRHLASLPAGEQK